jgi:hypothetical protein
MRRGFHLDRQMDFESFATSVGKTAETLSESSRAGEDVDNWDMLFHITYS